MSEPVSHKIRVLESIVAGTSRGHAAAPTDVEAVALCFRSVPFERIKRLTDLLADDTSRGIDDVDVLAAHLLLADYRSAVANLRTAAHVVAARLTAASASLKPVRGLERRLEKIAQKQAKRRG